MNYYLTILSTGTYSRDVEKKTYQFQPYNKKIRTDFFFFF